MKDNIRVYVDGLVDEYEEIMGSEESGFIRDLIVRAVTLQEQFDKSDDIKSLAEMLQEEYNKKIAVLEHENEELKIDNEILQHKSEQDLRMSEIFRNQRNEVCEKIHRYFCLPRWKRILFGDDELSR